MIIDVHTHLADWRIFSAQFLYDVAEQITPDGESVSFSEKLIRKMLSDTTGERLISSMDEAGIQKSILLIADYGYELGEAELSIEQIHIQHQEVLTRYPDRFILFSGVDPRRGIKGLKIFQQYIASGIASGMKLYPPCGFELNDSRLVPYFEICNDQNLPVLTHTGPSVKSLGVEKEYPASLLDVASKFPKISWILAHAPVWDPACFDIVKQHENIYVDISGFQISSRDTKQTSMWFRKLFDAIPHRVLFGSDDPMFRLGGYQKRWVDYIFSLNVLSEHEQDLLFWKNASRILDLKVF
jgi:uncharacterized protein